MKLQIKETIIVLVKASSIYGGEPVLNVTEGEIYSFTAGRGKTWKDWFIPSNAKGFWNPVLPKKMRRIKNAKCFELCGTIDQNEDHHFRIGMGKTNYSMPKSGTLHFFPNDSYKHYGNNRGFMKVEVTRDF